MDVAALSAVPMLIALPGIVFAYDVALPRQAQRAGNAVVWWLAMALGASQGVLLIALSAFLLFTSKRDIRFATGVGVASAA